VGAGHIHRLHQPGTSIVHRLPPQAKLAALFAFVVTVVLTPREQVWAFVVYALLLLGVALAAGLSPAMVLRRMVVELPFVIFAVLLPFFAQGPTTEVGPFTLSIDGLWGAWNILAKGTLGVAASVILAATTEPRGLLLGLERLKLPPILVHIATFMIRYFDVIFGEMHRMRVARESRGFQARHLGHVRVLAHSAGALFIRSYERGERVHLAMLSRGYTGSMPSLGQVDAVGRDWAVASVLPALAVCICLTAWMMTW
jgi:cobalt/nickel transport system permease protein